MARFKRILLKLSGESLMGEKQYGIDEKRLGEYAQQIKEIHDMGVQIGIVIGGGNIFRGLSGASSHWWWQHLPWLERCFKRFRPCEGRPDGYARNRHQQPWFE